jgi:hypothetical protein
MRQDVNLLRCEHCRGGKSVGRDERDIDAWVVEQEPEIAAPTSPSMGTTRKAWSFSNRLAMSAACRASEPAGRGPATRPSQAVSALALGAATAAMAIRARSERSELVRNTTPPHTPHRSYERSTSMLDEPQLKTGTEVPVCLRSCVCVCMRAQIRAKGFLLLMRRYACTGALIGRRSRESSSIMRP